jgi:DNA-binding NarL/FixJ family response regulator
VSTSVLVIDDDATFRDLARRMLAGMGFAVVGEAGTARAADVAARQLRPQAALVDVALPDGNGLDLAEKLAALPWAPRIVLTSSDPAAVTASVVQAAGAVAFVPKQDLPSAPLHALFTGRSQQE